MSTHPAKPVTIVIACASKDFAAGKKILAAQGFEARQIEFERISNDGYDSREFEGHVRGDTRVFLANGSLVKDVVDIQPQFVVLTQPNENARREFAAYPSRPCLIEAKSGRTAEQTIHSLLSHPALAS